MTDVKYSASFAESHESSSNYDPYPVESNRPHDPTELSDERPLDGSEAIIQTLPSAQADISETSSLWLIGGLLITIGIATATAIVIKIYKQKGNLTRKQKHTFNIIMTGLILLLALNFFEAFKALAKSTRGWILSRKRRNWTHKQKVLIGGIDSLMNVIKLAASDIKSLAALICLAWIVLNMLAQISVALISLTYSIDDGTNYNDTFTNQGTVHTSNLTCYVDFFNGNPDCTSDDDGTSLTLAHAYGDLIRSTPCCNYENISDVLASQKDCSYYCRRDANNQQFAYRFNEYNPNDMSRSYPHFTNRIITASSGKCLNYSQDGDPQGGLPDGQLLFRYYNDTYKGNITIPAALGYSDSTTYIYRGVKVPRDAEFQRCSPEDLRCMNVWAHRARGHNEPRQFYQCPITISNVANATTDIHDLSDDMARLAATSIALTGRKNDDGTWHQYQLYTFE